MEPGIGGTTTPFKIAAIVAAVVGILFMASAANDFFFVNPRESAKTQELHDELKGQIMDDSSGGASPEARRRLADVLDSMNESANRETSFIVVRDAAIGCVLLVSAATLLALSRRKARSP